MEGKKGGKRDQRNNKHSHQQTTTSIAIFIIVNYCSGITLDARTESKNLGVFPLA